MAERIRINTASAEEIDRLHGIGPELSQRIVEFRDEMGFFRGPDDLAKVKGISDRWAAAIAQGIDWEVPQGPPLPAVRDWTPGLAFLAGSCMSLGLVLQDVKEDIQIIFKHDRSTDVFDIIGTFFRIGFLTAGLCWSTGLAVAYLLASPHRKSAWGRFAAKASVVSMVFLAGMFVLLGILAAHTRGGLLFVLRDPQFWGAVGFAYLIFIFLAPPLILKAKPHLAKGVLFNRMVTVSFLIGAVVMGVETWAFPDALPLWQHIVSALFSLSVIIQGIQVLRGGESFSFPILYPENAVPQPKDNADYLLAWINEKLPDEIQQRALARVLSTKYRTPRRQSWFGYLLTITGVWVFTNTLSSILEVHVQDAWRDLLCKWLQLACR